jgi:hypothetical protein
MKYILGFLTTSFLVLTIAAVGFAFQEDMMKKQTNMMSKQPVMSKQKRPTKQHRKIYKHRKNKRIAGKFTNNK